MSKAKPSNDKKSSSSKKPAPTKAAAVELTPDVMAQNEAFANLDPISKAGLGLVKVDGIGFSYVGVAPARDADASTPDGYPITAENSTFTPLQNVPFDRSIRIKDAKSGEYYHAADGVLDWDGCELNGSYLIPRD